MHTITHGIIDSVNRSAVALSKQGSETFLVTPPSTRLAAHASQTVIWPVNAVAHGPSHKHSTSPQIASAGVIKSQSTALFEAVNIAKTPPSVSNSQAPAIYQQ